jgi:hypothetical protein
MSVTQEGSVRDYERQAEETRHRLADTLDELHDRLTPGDLLNEVLSYGKVGGGSALRAFGNAAKSNPIPALLIGAGCTMYLAEKTGLMAHLAASRSRPARTEQPFPRGSVRVDDRGSATQAVSSAAGSATQAVSSAAGSARSAVAGAADRMQEQAASLAEGIRDRAASVGGAASSAARSVGDGISGAAGSVGAAASSAADKVRESAGAARDMAADTASGVRGIAEDAMDQAGKAARDLGETVRDYSDALGDQMAGTAERARSQAAELMEQAGKQAKSLVAEQPLLVAAFGLAVGALIAAALPRTKAEDELMGETSDAVKETLGEVVGEQYQKAKEVAGTVAERAKSVAEEEGLAPGSVADIARNVGDKVKRVVTETASVAGSQLDDKFKSEKQV